MSETMSAPAPAPGAAPVPPTPTTTTTEPELPPAPAPGPTPVATTAAAIPEPTPAPEAPVSIPPVTTTTIPAMSEPTTTAVVAEPQPAQSVPAPATTAAVVAPLAPTTEVAEKAVEEPKPVVEEPQNKLTKLFTEAEWKSLKDFRSQLPDIFAQAFPDKPNARESAITMWGVALDPQDAHKDARVSVVLMKFLRARNLNSTAARDMLVGTLRWRESFGIQAALDEKFPENVFGGLGHVYGKDNGGRPVVYNIYGGSQDLKAAFGDVKRFIRWRVALMERSVDLLDFNEIDQTIQIHDYEGVSLTSRDANSKAAANEASNIFQSHYPELLYKKFFINVPTLLNWIFWAFKPLLSANTIAKMSVVGTGKGSIRRALVPYIDLQELPEKYGGLGKAPVDDLGVD